MPVSPKELDVNFKKEIAAFEIEIDRYLRTLSMTKGDQTWLEAPSRMTLQHFKVIREDYLQAGWSSVEIHGDQRQGDTIQFKY